MTKWVLVLKLVPFYFSKTFSHNIHKQNTLKRKCIYEEAKEMESSIYEGLEHHSEHAHHSEHSHHEMHDVHHKCQKHLYQFIQVELHDGAVFQGILHSYDHDKLYLIMPTANGTQKDESRIFPFFGPFGLFGFPFFGIRAFGPFFPFFI